MKKSDLISYASNFVSYLIKNKPKIDKVILFGSVARDEFDKDSDVDLFIDTDYNKNEIQSVIEVYEKGEEYEKYNLEGIKNRISVKVGRLDKWSSLKKSVISEGILLYGPYIESAENFKHLALYKISNPKKDRKDMVKFWRSLYGYTQKVGNKKYVSIGKIEELNGRKLSSGVFFVPFEKSFEINTILKTEKISFEIYEIYSSI